jgi:glutathione-regulated potassium-efflux system ancillary protein KefC
MLDLLRAAGAADARLLVNAIDDFDDSLALTDHVLETLGIDRFRAREMADWFRHHNLATMDALVPHCSHEAKMLSDVAAGREGLRQFFARDRAQFEMGNTRVEEGMSEL